MEGTLPLRLRREPIVDALFDVRLDANQPLHEVLPRLFYSQLRDVGNIESLPMAGIPVEVRRQHPELSDLPVVRILWGPYFISIGERGFSIGVKLPYPGWESFKPDIAKIINIALSETIAENVVRYSIKYTNLLEIDSMLDQVASVNWKVQVGDFVAHDRRTHVRLEAGDGNFTTLLNIATGAQVKLVTGLEKKGVLVDIDTICEKSESMQAFQTNLLQRLDDIRQHNKRAFFACLTRSTIDSLEPVYAYH